MLSRQYIAAVIIIVLAATSIIGCSGNSTGKPGCTSGVPEDNTHVFVYFKDEEGNIIENADSDALLNDDSDAGTGTEQN